jgi:hypothetical protein
VKLKVNRDYGEARRKAYPEIGDQLDEIWRGLEQLLTQGMLRQLPPTVNNMINNIKEIKQKYPKNNNVTIQSRNMQRHK